MTTNSRIDLQVPNSEKDQAKIHGAQFDFDKRTWYAPPGTNLENLKRWLPRGILTDSTKPDVTPPKVTKNGVSLTELFGQVKRVIDEGFPTAIWVRAEISELRGKNGHLRLNQSKSAQHLPHREHS